jgi:thiol:disulfide interchange protein DsbA
MKRRDFSATLLGAGLAATATTAALVVPSAAQAQGKPVSEADYKRVDPPAPTSTPGKIEVIEFFWYGCNHCYAFEPLVVPWSRKLPADVQFRRVPVAFSAAFAIHQRIFYALETLGKVEELQGKVFSAIHNDHQRLDKDEDVIAFMAKNGIDRAKFAEVFSSFSVATRSKQASRLADSYKIEGVPTLGINGRFITSGTHAGSAERALVVADTLIQQSRAKGA